MKNIEEMTDHELLMELVAEKRQRDVQKKIRIAIWIAIGILIIYLLWIYVPKIIEIYNKWDAMFEQIQSTGQKVDGVVEDIKNGPLKSLQSGIDSISGFLKKLGL